MDKAKKSWPAPAGHGSSHDAFLRGQIGAWSPISMNMRKSKLYTKKLKEQEAAVNAGTDIAWGNPIRSYVLQPYQMVINTRLRFWVFVRGFSDDSRDGSRS
ncbi:hypothetical protein PAPYR_11100 [Paratrimastix pyriformis]|uniref:Uncharacterized protein n=1 Tax=Paratrimastix pyriformis TaxID=342808 RepID=A0ABQ8UBR3_9EUKA|nr:hypothetical protein PAPYR_11100 [Paratrimastix pyriformis]